MLNLVLKSSNLAIKSSRFLRIQSSITKLASSSIVNQHQKSNLSYSKCLLNKTDLDLHKFLIEEIKSEKEITQQPKNGKNIPGFTVQENGADILLKRKYQNEVITIKFNVNASVDDGSQQFSDSAQEQPEEIAASMKSRPDFVVEIRKSDKQALVFNCSFLEDAEEGNLFIF